MMDYRQLNHFNRRVFFGNQSISYPNFVTVLESHPRILPVKSYNNDYSAGDPDAQVPYGQTWVNTPTNNLTVHKLRRDTIKQAWLLNMIQQPDSIQEKMILFWHNHFGVDIDDMRYSNVCWDYHALLVEHALGNFKTFIRDMTFNPAMLEFLSGAYNTVQGPNENYAREVIELFTMGRESGYGQEDIVTAAQCLTGINGQGQMILENHDTTRKIFGPFFGNDTVLNPATLEGAIQDVDDFLNMIFAKADIVSKFICTKLFRFFVHYDVTSGAALIQEMADAFKVNWEIKDALRVMISSSLFTEERYHGSLVKSPIDFIVGMFRELSIPIDSDPANFSWVMNLILKEASKMEMTLGEPPGVDGWKPYYQVPDFNRLWLNANTLQDRKAFVDKLFGEGFYYTGVVSKVNCKASAQMWCTTPENPDVLVLNVVTGMFPIQVDVTFLNWVKTTFLLSGQSENRYWTNLYTAAEAGDTMAIEGVERRLKDMFMFLVNHPQYNLL